MIFNCLILPQKYENVLSQSFKITHQGGNLFAGTFFIWDFPELSIYWNKLQEKIRSLAAWIQKVFA